MEKTSSLSAASILALAPKAVREWAATTAPTATHWFGWIWGDQHLWTVQALDHETRFPVEKPLAETKLALVAAEEAAAEDVAG